QEIDLYHHPVGIWIVTCTSQLRNLTPKIIKQEVGFPAGWDIIQFDDSLYCDTFSNFRVFINGGEVDTVNKLNRCPNYVDRIGNTWTSNDHAGIGFLNTWQLDFETDETKEVVVTFSFVVKKPAIIFNPDNKEKWYLEAVDWIKQEYVKKNESDFKLHLNLGSFWSSFVDTLAIRTYRSNDWLLIEPENEREYSPRDIIEYTYSEPIGFFSPRETVLTDLTEEVLSNKSKTELMLLRNTFPAKYGRPFINEVLNLFFEKQPWYEKDNNFDTWYINDFDLRNMKLIYEFEQIVK
ncbi:YARHG domain-containing protein, partial [candidate division KSB1 bacterium]|nr:YARHG domain-containing protein [candidate division KSB1 bacterium]